MIFLINERFPENKPAYGNVAYSIYRILLLCKIDNKKTIDICHNDANFLKITL